MENMVDPMQHVVDQVINFMSCEALFVSWAYYPRYYDGW